MNVKIILAIALLTAASYTVEAQTGAKKPVATNGQRIKQGVNNDELNRAEAARLKAQNLRLLNERKTARADGTVTTEERKDIRQDQKTLSKRIYRQKHDRQKRR